jgi:hypothetical protein
MMRCASIVLRRGTIPADASGHRAQSLKTSYGIKLSLW